MKQRQPAQKKSAQTTVTLTSTIALRGREPINCRPIPGGAIGQRNINIKWPYFN